MAGTIWSLPLAVAQGGWYWPALVLAIFAFTRRKGGTMVEGGCLYVLCEFLSMAGLIWWLPQAVAEPENVTAWIVLMASLWLIGWQYEDPFGLRLEKDWQMQLGSIAAAGVGLYWLLPVAASGSASWLQWSVTLLCLWVYTRRPEAPASPGKGRQEPPREGAGVVAWLETPPRERKEMARV